MVAKLIRYKNKVTFDYFTVYGDLESTEGEWYEGDDIPTKKAYSLSSQVCPWCIKKYGLYEEMNTTPEKIKKEIEFYKDEDPEELGYSICGVNGCNNGVASQDFNVDWKDCEIIG